MLFFGLTRVCYLIGVLLPVDYDFWAILGYVFQLIAMSALLFEFERSIVKKTKYSLTIFSLFGTAVAILSLSESINRDISMNLSTIVSTADTILIIVIFIYVIVKSTGIVRTRTLISFVGIIMVFIGQLLDTERLYGIWPTQPLLLSPILNIIGLMLIIINQRIHKT